MYFFIWGAPKFGTNCLFVHMLLVNQPLKSLSASFKGILIQIQELLIFRQIHADAVPFKSLLALQILTPAPYAINMHLVAVTL